MSIAVTPTNKGVVPTNQGVLLAKTRLAVTGLSQSADNVVPHGLPSAPYFVGFRPRASGGWNETASPDATNIYLTVAASGPTEFRLDVEYPVSGV